MNWEYISGFFDADGCITLTNPGKNNRRTIQLSFHNNERIILEKIKKFIFINTGYKGFISCKIAKKENHKDSYDLKYVYLTKCNDILSNMNLAHPKKIYRKTISLKLKEFTPRNGKYTDDILKQREKLEELFFKEI